MTDNTLVISQVMGPRNGAYRRKCEKYSKALEFWRRSSHRFPDGATMHIVPYTILRLKTPTEVVLMKGETP